MTDQPEEKGPKLPPRIKLNLNAEAASPPPAANSDGAGTVPPKAKIAPPSPTDAPKPAEPQGGKIKLNMDEALKEVEKQAATPAPAPQASDDAKPKIKLNLDIPETEPAKESAKSDAPTPETPAEKPPAPANPPKDSTSEERPKIKLNLAEVDAPKPSVAADEPPKAEAAAAPAKPKLALKTKPTPPEPANEAPQPPPAEAAAEAQPEEKASEDKSIQLENIDGESLDDLYQAALNATQRVILDEKEKAATNKIDTDESQVLKKAELAEASKKSTARLDLGEMLSDDERQEIMKHETMHISADGSSPAKPKPSGTMKIQRPDSPAPEAASDSTMAIPLDLEESKKSETARIDLPRELASSKPSSGRKTIRIKRPDGSGAAARPALNVARSSSSSSESAPTSAETAARNAISFDADDSDVDSPAFGALALVAVLVGLALVYVLVATMVPALPFPGRLV